MVNNLREELGESFIISTTVNNALYGRKNVNDVLYIILEKFGDYVKPQEKREVEQFMTDYILERKKNFDTIEKFLEHCKSSTLKCSSNHEEFDSWFNENIIMAIPTIVDIWQGNYTIREEEEKFHIILQDRNGICYWHKENGFIFATSEDDMTDPAELTANEIRSINKDFINLKRPIKK